MAATTYNAKGYPVQVSQNETRNVLLDVAVDCGEANAVNIQCFVTGSNPSATVSLEGASERAGNYLPLPDINASRSVTGNVSFDVIVGSRWAKVRLAGINPAGYGAGQGFTIFVTPYVSPGSPRVAASISVENLAAISAQTGALTVGTGGSISSGATAFMTGNGYWLAYNAGTPQMRIGTVSAGALVRGISWDGAGLNVDGNVTIRGGSGILNLSDAGAVAVLDLVTADYISVATLSAISANLGTVTAGSIVVGTTNKIWLNEGADGVLAIGGAVKADAPFRVTAAGAFTATNATITGSITANSGAIGGFTLGTTALTGDNIVIDKASGITLYGSTWATGQLRLLSAVGGNYTTKIWNNTTSAIMQNLDASGGKYGTLGLTTLGGLTISAASGDGVNPPSALINSLLIQKNGSNWEHTTPCKIYPGTGAAIQSSRSLSDDGSYTVISGGLKLGASLYPGNQTTDYLGYNADAMCPLVSGSLHITGSLGVGGATPGPTAHVRVTTDQAFGVVGKQNLSTGITLWSYNDAYNAFKGMEFGASEFRFTTGHVTPGGAGTQNFGDGTNYWNDISYKTLTDRGCLGWFDGGVELQDGRLVSDIEALMAIRKHPAELTVYGVPRLDYSTMPKAVYKPVPRDKDGNPIGADGAETTALISIMLGAIKETYAKVAELEKQLAKGNL